MRVPKIKTKSKDLFSKISEPSMLDKPENK